MRCGSDYHGGNTQHGCGRSFNWNDALRYEAQITALPVITATERQRAKGVTHDETGCVRAVPNAQITALPVITATERQRAKRVKHDVLDACERCRTRIVGPRFQCVECANRPIASV